MVFAVFTKHKKLSSYGGSKRAFLVGYAVTKVPITYVCLTNTQSKWELSLRIIVLGSVR